MRVKKAFFLIEILILLIFYGMVLGGLVGFFGLGLDLLVVDDLDWVCKGACLGDEWSVSVVFDESF